MFLPTFFVLSNQRLARRSEEMYFCRIAAERDGAVQLNLRLPAHQRSQLLAARILRYVVVAPERLYLEHTRRSSDAAFAPWLDLQVFGPNADACNGVRRPVE